MSGLVGSILGSKLRSKFADPQETKEPKSKGCPEHQTIMFFSGVWLQPLLHVTQHFQSQWQSCRLVVNGPLEALETLDDKSQHRIPGCSALVPKGVMHCCHIHLYGPKVHELAEVDCKLCNSFFRARDWDQLEGVAETVVASGTSGLDGCGRWGQGSGQMAG